MTDVDLIRGETFHGRKGAVRNSFRYSVDYVLLDPDRAHLEIGGDRLAPADAAGDEDDVVFGQRWQEFLRQHRCRNWTDMPARFAALDHQGM